MVDERKKRLSIDIIKINSDAIFSPSEIAQESSSTRPDATLLARYLYLDRQYFKLGTTYTRQHLLSQLSLEFHHLLSWDSFKSYRLITHISSIFHLNSLEIASWSIFLNRSSAFIFKPRLLAYFTAYQAKLSLTYDISIYDNFINTKIPNFKLLFNNWQLILDSLLEPSLKELNKKFSEMSKKGKVYKNYKNLIDGLMEVPKRKESVMSEQLTETSQIEDMENELQEFQKVLMNGEKLSPICDL